MKKYSLALAALVFSSSAAFSATYQFDKSASTITWSGGKQFTDSVHTGKIALKEGEVEMPAKGAPKGKIVIDMTSISNDDVQDATYKAKLEGHLKSEDFFKVDQYKEAVLVIKDMKQDAKEKTKYDVKADLTIRGKTQPVSFPVSVVEKDGKVEVTGKLNIDRTQYGVAYASPESFSITDVSKVVESKIKDVKDKVIKKEFTVDVKLVGKEKGKA
jgi:polyisoprenoid-binding protein YceI